MDISAKINELMAERDRIDATLASVSQLLGEKKMGRPPGVKSVSPVSVPKAKRGRGAYGMTADDFVLNFVRQAKNPTTRDINTHWKGERKGTADNTLVRLVKLKQLKRVPMPGERGSRYEAKV